MWMAREMTLSREWKTSELRQVAMALRGQWRSASSCWETEAGIDSRSETTESQSVAGFEEVGIAGEDPELFCGGGGRRGQRGSVEEEGHEAAHVDEDEGVDGVAAVVKSDL